MELYSQCPKTSITTNKASRINNPVVLEILNIVQQTDIQGRVSGETSSYKTVEIPTITDIPKSTQEFEIWKNKLGHFLKSIGFKNRYHSVGVHEVLKKELSDDLKKNQ